MICSKYINLRCGCKQKIGEIDKLTGEVKAFFCKFGRVQREADPRNPIYFKVFIMEIADFIVINPIKLIGVCFLISVFHININFGHTAIHNGRLCNHRHPKVHDVSLLKK